MQSIAYSVKGVKGKTLELCIDSALGLSFQWLSPKSQISCFMAIATIFFKALVLDFKTLLRRPPLPCLLTSRF